MQESQAVTVQNAAGQPQTAFVPQHPKVERKTEKYKGVLYGLGIAEVVLGSISALLTIVALILVAQTRGSPHGLFPPGLFTYPAQGLWCGVILATTGILGILAKSRPSVCMYNANMAMSIVTTVFMAVLVVASSFAAIFAFSTSGIAIHIIIALIGFTGFIISIVHAAYCCAGVCSCGGDGGKNVEGVVLYVPPQQQAVSQVTVNPDQAGYQSNSTAPNQIPENAVGPTAPLYPAIRE